MLAVFAVYASVGQAGGTGFLAVMAVSGIPVDQLRPAALAMNVVTPALIVLGWARPREAAGLSAPFILSNSITGLAFALLSSQQLAPDFGLFAAAALPRCREPPPAPSSQDACRSARSAPYCQVLWRSRASASSCGERLASTDQRSRGFNRRSGGIGLRSLRYWMLLTFGQSGFAMLSPNALCGLAGTMTPRAYAVLTIPNESPSRSES